MKKKCPIIFLSLISLLFQFGDSSAQPVNSVSQSKVGGLKLPDYAFGLFGMAAHVNQDSTFTGYVNYSARLGLWVGAVTSRGQVLVTSATGNDKTRRPEWSPDHKSFQTRSGTSNVKKVVSLSYSDDVTFSGHTPLGLKVQQEVTEFVNAGYAILKFAISLDNSAAALDKVYVGLFADIDAPDGSSRKTAGNDVVGVAVSGSAPYIFDSSISGKSIPLLGATILGVQSPIISWWEADADPVGDQAEYDCLQGKVTGGTPGQSGDVRFLLSYGPLSLNPGESIDFPVALAQASSVPAFEAALNNASQFFNQQMNTIPLASKLSDSPQMQTSFDVTPEDFKLYSNYPNPFNPATAIQFDLPEAVHVQVKIYNSRGQLVRTLVDHDYSAGTFEVMWNGQNDNGRQLPSGVYVYRITAGDFQTQRKLLLLK